MIYLRKAINEILSLKQQTVEGTFAHASTGPESHLAFIKAVGQVQGLDMALNILLALTKGDSEE
jgi:hypothetical protein